ncbi:uncharacterized protein BCR38DRAFT_337999 [Pseudomassariella vexata]|uniref:Steroid 5-alpha reductase C-terminal domain-containing protein n=1 Tax=Pseudomassariella vexata TaxID=1141098 RepID=A0A1Y2E7E8_9PEZI|nr:uncharacterized protein BCR38DRAFT_337999 [Pseudomassariella vexata]ORY67206.1 hypothetical protein BCR38DRAFT_337999 [Pseudomassariella vexata]
MPNPSPADKAKAKPMDLINRGSKKPSPFGTATFIGLRALDIPWQYHLLHNGAAERGLSVVGLPALNYGAAATTGVALLDKLELSLPRLLLLAMATGSTLKQILWLTVLSQEEFPFSAAVVVGGFNTVFNTVNTLLFTCAYTSSSFSGPKVSLFGTTLPPPVVLGTLAYATGLTIETLSEYQRMKFKQDPKNQGKVCKTGLWSWARHINYFGYALWRGGYCMTGGGYTIGLLTGLWQGWELSSRAVVVLDEYCGNKYGEQWVQFKKDVPYRIIPGMY